LITFLLAVGLLGWMVAGNIGKLGTDVVIEPAGQSAFRVPLAGSDRMLPVKGQLGSTTIEVAGNRVRVVSSPCPRRICMSMGWISRPGETLVCFPNGMVVRIEGSGNGGMDAITQ
jgi:hypothetical protein